MQLLKIVSFLVVAFQSTSANAQWVVLDYLDLRCMKNVDSISIHTGGNKKEMVLVYNKSGKLIESLHYDTLSGQMHSINRFFYSNNRRERIVFESSIRQTDYISRKTYRTKLKPFQTTVFNYHQDTLSSIFYVGDLLGLSSDTSKSFYSYYQDSVVISFQNNDRIAKMVKHFNSNGTIDSVSYFEGNGSLTNKTIYSYHKKILAAVEIRLIRDLDGELYENRKPYVIQFHYDRNNRLIKYEDQTVHHLTYYNRNR